MINGNLLNFSSNDFAAMSPYLTLFIGVNVVILLSLIKKLERFDLTFWMSLACLVIPLIMSAGQLFFEPMSLFNNMLIVDSYSQFFCLLILASAIYITLASRHYLKQNNLNYSEYYILILFSTLGMMLMDSTLDLIVMFIGLEIMSLTVYTLVAFKRHHRLPNEAAVKYFIVGSVASALFLYGSALLYGSFGSLNLASIFEGIQNQTSMPNVAMLGICFLLIGFLIKIAAVPFHMWMPDVYEGAITPITGFMTTALKITVFAALIRIVANLDWVRFVGDYPRIETLLWVVAFITMLLANITALTQTSIKRMLGYSSIGHTGYLIVGLIAVPFSEIGYTAMVNYLVAYIIMNLGAFVVLSHLASRSKNNPNSEVITLQSLSGLASKSPFLAFALATFMFSLAGVPPTVGFIGKYYLFYSGIEAGQLYLIIAAVLCSSIAAYYYLRVIVYMYMRPADEGSAEAKAECIPLSTIIPVTSLVLLTFALGLFPSGLLSSIKAILLSLNGRI